jgi:hypothetical protein
MVKMADTLLKNMLATHIKDIILRKRYFQHQILIIASILKEEAPRSKFINGETVAEFIDEVDSEQQNHKQRQTIL